MRTRGRVPHLACLGLSLASAFFPFRAKAEDAPGSPGSPGSGVDRSLSWSLESVETAPLGLETLPPLRPVSPDETFAPSTLALDGLGRLFILDRGRGQIVRLDAQGGWLPFAVGDQGGPRFAQISALFARSGADLFALDPAAEALYQLDLDGNWRKRLVYGPAVLEARLGFIEPADFALTKAGDLLLLDRSGGRVLLFDRFGRFVTELTQGQSGSAHPVAPTSLVLGPGSEDLYLLDPPGAWIRRYSRQGTFRSAWRYDQGPEGGAPLPAEVAVTPWNQVVVAARDGSWIRLFLPEGKQVFEAAAEILPHTTISDLEAGSDSLIYLACPKRGEIQRLRLLYPDHDPASGR